ERDLRVEAARDLDTVATVVEHGIALDEQAGDRTPTVVSSEPDANAGACHGKPDDSVVVVADEEPWTAGGRLKEGSTDHGRRQRDWGPRRPVDFRLHAFRIRTGADVDGVAAQRER